MPRALLSGTKAATGAIADAGGATWIFLRGPFNFVLSGTFDATVNLERSFADPSGTADWNAVEDAFGVSDFNTTRALVGNEPEGAWYRMNVTARSSGTVEGRLSQ